MRIKSVNPHDGVICLVSLPTKQCKCMQLFLVSQSGLQSFFFATIHSCRLCILHACLRTRKLDIIRLRSLSYRHHAGTDVSQTYHSAVGHGALGFAGTFGALPPLCVSVRRLADLEDIPGGSGAVFAPIRCRTHAYTSTNKTALIQNDFALYSHPLTPSSTTFSLPASPPCTYCSPYSPLSLR